MKTKTMREIAEETFAFYEDKKNIAFENWECKYITEDGRCCAVGRCLTNPEKIVDSADDIFTLFKTKQIKFSDFKKEYRLKDLDFWGMLQKWHDKKAVGSLRDFAALKEEILEYCLKHENK